MPVKAGHQRNFENEVGDVALHKEPPWRGGLLLVRITTIRSRDPLTRLCRMALGASAFPRGGDASARFRLEPDAMARGGWSRATAGRPTGTRGALDHVERPYGTS